MQRAPAKLHSLKSLCFSYAHQLFGKIPHRNSSWISTKTNAIVDPIELIKSHLCQHGIPYPPHIASALKVSSRLAGAQLHGLSVSSGLDSYTIVSNSLMNMYSKTGSFDLACKIFDNLQNPDVVSWNTVLCGFHSGIDALEFVVKMRQAGVPPDPVSFTSALAFAADSCNIEFTILIHSLVLKSGFDADTFVGNALITAYSRSARVEDAKAVFDELAMRDLVSWNALLCGLTQEGNYGLDAIYSFRKMVREGLKPDHVSYSSVISSCCQERCYEVGCQVHGFALKYGLETHVSVANVLMTMYYKHGAADKAAVVFQHMDVRNVISWTTMISLDTDNAVTLFDAMRLCGIEPNDVTFVALIYAVASEQLKSEGDMIHCVCLKCGISGEVNVSNSLITMYAKLESMQDARKIFEDVENKDIISWNALISGYAQNGLSEQALEAFSLLLLHCKPNEYTFGSILSAITILETVSLSYGQGCHCRIIKQGLSVGEYVAGALIDMYAKHGSIYDAQRTFQETKSKSLVSWTAVISASAKYGNYENVMCLFEEMVHSGIRPDHITFLAVLTACACKGMVDKGLQVFDMMVAEHGIEPWPEHYSCIVDMFGRAGRLDEAVKFIRRIPVGPGLSALQSLLGACTVHGNMEIGKRMADALMEMEPMESGSYVLISNLHAEKGEWDSVAKIRKRMREIGIKKEVGFSWVDAGIKNSIHMHKFSSDDSTHPLAEYIYEVAQSLGDEMRMLKSDKREIILMALD